MLGWMNGQSGHSATKTMVEPPDTPAPVFAIRAFKSALFGTPGAENHDDADPTPRPRKQSTLNYEQGKTEEVAKLVQGERRSEEVARESDTDSIAQPMPSPTKSILVTPGTMARGRKSVTFGDGVVDNERKQNLAVSKVATTPPRPSTETSSQWTSTSSNGSRKPLSKLTQTLLDARDKSTKSDRNSRPSGSEQQKQAATVPEQSRRSEDAHDETMNMDEPRSQSGKYWKGEFESYRANTNREIKRLIQYRSFAKQYARKKDAEAVRLSDRLREEEAKVTEMERHVTQLAATMVGNGANGDKEKLVQELAKQTALALQYKHRATLLRKMLERHGVVGDEIDKTTGCEQDGTITQNTAEELRKTLPANNDADDKAEQTRQRKLELESLKYLAESSERKSTELEKENASLKQTLARVKQEMSKYEGRRKEKEARLKQREAKLETRVQEYRERIKQYRESEEALKDSWEQERHRFQEEIDLLKLKVTTLEHFPETGNILGDDFRGYRGLRARDSDFFNQHEPTETGLIDFSNPPSPSPRAKERSRRSRVSASAMMDVENATKLMGVSVTGNEDDHLYPGPSWRKAQTLPSRYKGLGDIDPVPPSSPPDLPEPARPLAGRGLRQPAGHRRYTSLKHDGPRFNHTDISQNRPQRVLSRHSPIRHSLESISALHRPRTTQSDIRKLQSEIRQLSAHPNDEELGRVNANAMIDSLPAERIAAAQARLRRKELSRKTQDEEKENVEDYRVSNRKAS